MKRILVAAAFLLLVAPSAVHAMGVQNRTFGLGVNIGEPMGVNGRYFFTKQFVGDLTLGYGFIGERSFVVQPSALFYFRDIINLDTDEFSLVPYFGMGLKSGVDTRGAGNNFLMAMRFPIGAAFVVSDGLIEISVEYGNGVRFTPNSGYDYTGGLGLRYYFY